MSKRSLANDLCDRGTIKVNDALGKPSRAIQAGDQIEIRRGIKILIVNVLAIPDSKQVSKDVARSLYQILSETNTSELD